jgi:hypothetical protein
VGGWAGSGLRWVGEWVSRWVVDGWVSGGLQVVPQAQAAVSRECLN